jgi:hypothetical protein
MDTREAFQLLTLASARDGRTVDVEVATVWADDLKDVTLPDAVEAARMHYQSSDAWLMPAHVRENVRVIWRRREREARVLTSRAIPRQEVTLDREAFERETREWIEHYRKERADAQG